MGFNTDRREAIYNALNKTTLNHVEQLHTAGMANKPHTFCVLASNTKINMDDLKKIGDVKELSLKEIFDH